MEILKNRMQNAYTLIFIPCMICIVKKNIWKVSIFLRKTAIIPNTKSRFQNPEPIHETRTKKKKLCRVFTMCNFVDFVRLTAHADCVLCVIQFRVSSVCMESRIFHDHVIPHKILNYILIVEVDSLQTTANVYTFRSAEESTIRAHIYENSFDITLQPKMNRPLPMNRLQRTLYCCCFFFFFAFHSSQYTEHYVELSSNRI